MTTGVRVRPRLVGLFVVLVVSVVAGLSLTGASGATPSGGCSFNAGTGKTTCTFSYTGAREAWTVPAGVTSAVFDVYGGAGGSYVAVPGGSGGLGGHVQATLTLTPGATLYLRVGGQGADGLGEPGPFDGTLTAAGGFNGGGTNTITCSGCSFVLGGAGGGASDVRSASDGLADRLLVAGGGGGGGIGTFDPSPQPGDGGDSAATAPSLTSEFGGPSITCSGGGAGTLLGPGAAGSGPLACQSGSAGDAAGGAGGNGITFMGAGGGGYYGGGAGAIGGPADLGTGGGGGSDYPNPASPPAGISNVTVTDGVQSGNGLVTVTYTSASDQLSALKAAVTGVGQDKNLANEVKKIQGYVAGNDKAGACSELKAFIKQINAMAANKQISQSQAASLTAQAMNIEKTVGC